MKVHRKAASERPPALPRTIGDHIRSIRSERKLLQREVAKEIGVSAATIGNWEKNRSQPPIEFMPAIIAFIGIDPMPEPAMLGERMRAYRVRGGLSIRAAAQRAGVHEDTWAEWERTGVIAWRRYRLLVEQFLGATAGDSHAASLAVP